MIINKKIDMHLSQHFTPLSPNISKINIQLIHIVVQI